MSTPGAAARPAAIAGRAPLRRRLAGVPGLPAVAVALLALVLWSALARWGGWADYVLPSPAQVLAGLGEDLASGRLATDVIASLYRVMLGYGLACALGVPCGLVLGHAPLARAALLPGVNFFRALSPLAWIPFAILWFGIGDVPVVFLIFMATFFPLVLAVMGAVANVPPIWLRVGREYGLRGPRLLAHVTLPAILPQLITALRVTVGLAWLVVVAAEMVAGRDGLGFAIWDARNGLRADLLVARMAAIGTIGVVLDALLGRLTRLPGVRWGHGG